MGERRMGRWVGMSVLLLLAIGFAGGGFLIYRGFRSMPNTEPQSPVYAAAPSLPALPPPELSDDALTSPSDPVARVLRVNRSVKAKRADSLAWEDAQAPMVLFRNDAVRTFDRSSTTLAFGPDDEVRIGQNSLVVIKPLKKRKGTKEISLALLSSDLLLDLADRPVAEQREEIAAAAAEREVLIRPIPSIDGKPAKTQIATEIMSDQSTRIASLGAPVEMVGPLGDQVVLKKNMVTTITSDGLLAEPRQLPDAPVLVSPKNGSTYTFLRKAPPVKLNWRASARASGYRVVVARDRAFRRILADETIPQTSFTIRNLQPGTYFWRVMSEDVDGFQGEYSEIRSIRASLDTRPPRLTILEPPEMFVSPGPTVALRGLTDSGARVRVSGEVVTVNPDGSFTYILTLQEGVNLVTVEAINASGNTEYEKRLITYRGSKRSISAASAGGR